MRTQGEIEKEYNRALSRRIARAIHAAGMTYGECARALGLHENTVYRWTCSKPTIPRPYTLARLCAALGIDANDLLGVRR